MKKTIEEQVTEKEPKQFEPKAEERELIHLPVKTIERQGLRQEPQVRHYPRVIANVCEYHGIIDSQNPRPQYQLCPCYKDMQLMCSYCDAARDPEEVNYKATLKITDHPDRPDKLVVVCDNFLCTQKHQKRFQR